MPAQQTIASDATIDGPGLFTGRSCRLTFKPAPADHGVAFVRTDLHHTRIPAHISHITRRPRRSALRAGEAAIDTVEHCLSAVAGLELDNLLIELDGPELPALDGSADGYVRTLLAAGIQPIDGSERQRFVIAEPVVVSHEGASIAAVPSERPGLSIMYEMDYGPGSFIGQQLRAFDLSPEVYLHELAAARTFVLEQEALALQKAGVGTHLTADDIPVIGPKGPIGKTPLRFPDEPVRHKLLDLVGDLFLLGAHIQGRVIACKSGHALNHALVRRLLKQADRQKHDHLRLHRSTFDIRRLLRILPHRYPMLLVDRILEIDGDRRAVGVKNVSVNEPFFPGHFPAAPIMPGVLIVEAMAQLSGIVIGQKLENSGMLAILLSMDHVKLRRAVTPGDQLILEAETVKLRSRLAHMRCRAYVGEELAAEAEIKFMLVEPDQAT